MHKIPQKDALSFVDMADPTCILTQGILYAEINHLRKAAPIQLYQILNKGKMLKNSRKLYFSLFSSNLKPNLTNHAKNRKNQFLIY